MAAEPSWKNGPRLATLKSWRTLNARDPQAVLGSQGRLSTAAELMTWFTTPVLNSAESVRTVPAWQNEHLACRKRH